MHLFVLLKNVFPYLQVTSVMQRSRLEVSSLVPKSYCFLNVTLAGLELNSISNLVARKNLLVSADPSVRISFRQGVLWLELARPKCQAYSRYSVTKLPNWGRNVVFPSSAGCRLREPNPEWL